MEKESLNKGELTRAAVIEAAYTLFVQQGYHGTSMRQIAQKADLALGGIYNHFDSKEAIFKAVIIAYHPFVAVIPRLEDLEDDVTEGLLRSAARLFVSEMEKQRGLFNLMFIEMIELDGRHMPELVDMMLPYMRRFQQRVAAQQRRSLHAQTPVAFFRSFLGTVVAYYLMNELLAGTSAMQQGPLSIDDMMDIYLHGIFLEDGAA
jgi:TetR/AcrR family transcriptional regulator of autoinduction and epiphytic fitness